MGKSKIEWCDKTWNPVTGCAKVSEGCRNCYAERHAKRFWGDRKFSDVQCHAGRLHQPLHWKKPQRIFVNSMSDLFHPDVPDHFIDVVFITVANYARQHTYIVLTKRPERMQKYFQEKIDSGFTWREGITGIPIPNLWLGVSIEDQETADERIPWLLKTPAAVRVISYEPALGPVDFNLIRQEPCSHIGCFQHVSHPCEGCGYQAGRLPIDWIICGGESGPGARPMHPDWARSVRNQCQAAGVPFFFKQWGEWIHELQVQNNMPIHAISSKRMLVDSIYQYIKVGKKNAGRLLDGREWNEFP